jgi:hypothetical protein
MRVLAEAEKHRDSSLTPQTSMDVYGRPRMAPRAGFEISPKYLVREDHALANRRRTPSDTPASLGLETARSGRQLSASEVRRAYNPPCVRSRTDDTRDRRDSCHYSLGGG